MTLPAMRRLKRVRGAGVLAVHRAAVRTISRGRGISPLGDRSKTKRAAAVRQREMRRLFLFVPDAGLHGGGKETPKPARGKIEWLPRFFKIER